MKYFFTLVLSVVAFSPQYPLGQFFINSESANRNSMNPEFNLLTHSSLKIIMKSTDKKIDLGTSQDMDRWYITNDGVMGGLSQGYLRENDSSLVFYGELSLENNGGFSRTQRRMENIDYSDFKGVRMRMRGDARTYTFTVESHSGSYGPSYQMKFKAEGEWKEYFFPFEELSGSIRGRKTGKNFDNPEELRRIGILLADKEAGSFKLEIDWIDFE